MRGSPSFASLKMQLRGTDNDLSLEVEGELDSLSRIQRIPIRFGETGQFAFLSDIAQIDKGIRQPPSDIAIVSGRPAVVIAAFVESQRRIDRWNRQVQSVLDDFQKTLPSEIGIRTVLEQTTYVSDRLRELMFNLVLGAILVFGVTLFLMGWQAALIVGAALPPSILMVFGWMGIVGVSLNQISITGLIVALGILIQPLSWWMKSNIGCSKDSILRPPSTRAHAG